VLTTELTHPEVLQLIAQCGHGDSIAVVDSNYPAHARRSNAVPLVSLNVTHNLPSTPTLVGLISRSLPVESFTIPVPDEEASSAEARVVHEAIASAVVSGNPTAEKRTASPTDFYGLTSDPNLAFMVMTGDRSHYGSVLLTVGYLPELSTTPT